MICVEFGQRLRELRHSAGLTQEQLAKRVGLTKSVISFYELSERSPSPNVIIKFARVFHVSADYLLGIEKKRSVDISDLSDEQVRLIETMVSAMRSSKTP